MELAALEHIQILMIGNKVSPLLLCCFDRFILILAGACNENMHKA